MASSNDTVFLNLPVEGVNESIESIERLKPEEVISRVYDALKEKGYDPVTQLVGYIITGDPTYITNYKEARSTIMKAERDDILSVIVSHYVSTKL